MNIYKKKKPSCTNHIEFLFQIYKTFLKWSQNALPSPSPARYTKLLRGRRNRNKHFWGDFHVFYQKVAKLVPKWSQKGSNN